MMTGANDTGRPFTTCVNDTGGKIMTDVIGTNGKLIAGVIEPVINSRLWCCHGCSTLSCKYLRNFLKNLKMALLDLSRVPER